MIYFEAYLLLNNIFYPSLIWFIDWMNIQSRMRWHGRVFQQMKNVTKSVKSRLLIAFGVGTNRFLPSLVAAKFN